MQYSLTKIYADLCKICEQPKVNCKGFHTSLENSELIKPIVNVYEGLTVEDEDVTEETVLVAPTEECTECQIDSHRMCPGPDKDIRLADDDLGNAIEYASALQDIQQTVHEIEQCWSRAAKGEVHFVSAAYLTHIGYAALLQVERRLRDLNEDINIADLQEKCCKLLDQPDGAKSEWHELLQRLAAHQQTVDHLTREHKSATPTTEAPLVQKPVEYITENTEPSNTVSALLHNATALIRSISAPSAIVRNSTPVYADLGYLLFHSGKQDNQLRLSLSLHLLTQSYTSYVLNLEKPILACNTRLAALRLAQSAASSVGELIEDKNCFPCRCAQTLAFHLQNLETDLKAYSQQNKWDLLFQSPYVAGSHILEMLDLCHYYGSKLFVYRHYIGSLVHSYNVMTQLGGLEKIPLMEYLCEEFKHAFFPAGERPTRSFRGCWTRYIGARIKFKKSHKRNNKDSWCMAIPPHEARKAAGLGVGRNEASGEKGECLVFKIKQRDYDVTEPQWEQIQSLAERTQCRCPDQTKMEDETAKPPLSKILPLLESELVSAKKSEPDSHLPKAKLNHFKVFRDCVKIIGEISDSTHTDKKERGMNCICFASAILEGADRIVDARALRMASGKGSCWTKDEREGVLETTGKAMREVLGGKKVTGKDGWEWEF